MSKPDVAKHYFDNVSRITVLHARDVLQLLLPEIESAKTVLDIGCGPATFGLAYLEAFPQGIPGQTLICSDLSPGMVEQAEKVMRERMPQDFQTVVKWQVMDGTTLEGIPDSSIDVVISVFGIFIIPDYQQTLGNIRRVLVKGNPNAVFGTAVWTMTDHRKKLQDEGYGPHFHELIEDSLQELTNLSNNGDKDESDEPPWKRWFEPSRVRTMVVEEANFDSGSFQVHRSLHSVVWPRAQALWDMIASNPTSKMHQASPEKVEAGKHKLYQALERSGESDLRPVIASTASNLIIARVE